MNIKRIISISITLTALVACSKPVEPVKSIDESAAGRAAAAMAASATAGTSADKANADLARIRQLKEAEAAERDALKQSSKSTSQQMIDGAKRPLKSYN